MTRAAWMFVALVPVACGELLLFSGDDEEQAPAPTPQGDAGGSEIPVGGDASTSPGDAASAWACAVVPGAAESTAIACGAARDDAGCLSGMASEADGGACTSPATRVYCEPCHLITAGGDDIWIFNATRCDCR